jgi:hypothetical protein
MEKRDFVAGKSHISDKMPLISWNVIACSVFSGLMCFLPFFIAFAVYALDNPDSVTDCYVAQN